MATAQQIREGLKKGLFTFDQLPDSARQSLRSELQQRTTLPKQEPISRVSQPDISKIAEQVRGLTPEQLQTKTQELQRVREVKPLVPDAKIISPLEKRIRDLPRQTKGILGSLELGAKQVVPSIARTGAETLEFLGTKPDDIRKFSPLQIIEAPARAVARGIAKPLRDISEFGEQQIDRRETEVAPLLQTKGEKLIGEVARGVGQVGATALTGPARTPAFISTAIGSRLQEGEQKGLNPNLNRARAYTLGALEGGIEALNFGNIFKNLKGSRALTNALATTAKGGASEFGEEIASSLGEFAFDKSFVDPKTEFDVGETFRNAAVSGMSAMVVSGVGAGVQSAQNIQRKLQTGQEVTPQEVKQMVEDVEQATDTRLKDYIETSKDVRSEQADFAQKKLRELTELENTRELTQQEQSQRQTFENMVEDIELKPIKEPTIAEPILEKPQITQPVLEPTPEAKQPTDVITQPQRLEKLTTRDVIKEIKTNEKGELIGRPSPETKQQFEEFKQVAQNIPEISPKKLFNTDFQRNMEQIFQANPEVAQDFTQKFDQAKFGRVQDIQNEATDLKTNIVNKFGIQKGSKESSAIQDLGEGRLTVKELKTKFPEQASNIIEADKWFRSKYDNLIDQLNDSRATIYGDVKAQKQKIQDQITQAKLKLKEKETLLASKKRKDTKVAENLISSIELLKDRIDTKTDQLADEGLWRNKQIPKRKDYYRHFQEMTEGFAGLKNLFSARGDIDPKLVGLTPFTKPKTRFLGIAQQRKGGDFKSDAVGGFLDYIEAFAYAKNIDPQIAKIRNLTKLLQNATVETVNANNVIDYLNDFANDLAGKTNPGDRFIQDKQMGRKAFKGINFLNNRAKANAVLFNVSSSLSQISNLPMGIAKIKNPVDLGKGLRDTVSNIFNKDNNIYDDSAFISERYSENALDKFNTKLLDQPKKAGVWMITALDEASTKYMWNAFREKALREGIEDPTRFADIQTRKIVAGRGVGELPLSQKAQVTKLFAPFTVEVANSWKVMKDFVDERDFAGLVVMFMLNFLLNRGFEATGKSAVVFDPIDALVDATTEEDISLLERGGRVGGEVLSNVPFGQFIASVYPEFGTDIAGLKLPTRKQLFGRSDPTRFGVGIPATQALTDPIFSLLPAFGGKQVKRTIRGTKALIEGERRDKRGKQLFPVAPTLENIIKAPLLGEFATPEAKRFQKGKEDKFSILPEGDKLKDLSKFFTPQTTGFIPLRQAPQTIKVRDKKIELSKRVRDKYLETYTEAINKSLLPQLERTRDDIENMSQKQAEALKTKLTKQNTAAKKKAERSILPLLTK